MLLIALLTVPLMLSLISLFNRRSKASGIINAAGYAVILLCALRLTAAPAPVALFNFLYADALSVYFILVIAVINFASALYSIGYIEDDRRRNIISARKSSIYYMLFNLFSFTMFLVPMLNNLGMVWVAIELTTLTSAFLVGFYNDKQSVEAAWKYVVVCSVGIALALFGTILFYYTASLHGGVRSLNWTDIVAVASKLDPQIVKIAFIFILVGYGTKAGLAPMHTWLPDAHSQALAPISALLSGVLLKTSVYAILRFVIVVNKTVGPHYTGNLLTIIGLLSMGIAAGFILVQKDIKRLLAYSSIEHVGVIAVGLGLGGPAGCFGALLHVFNHAATKSLMFFGAGKIVKTYGTHNMRKIRGVIQAMPFVGFFVILGAFALGGSPPFSLFVSEIIILTSGFTQGAYLSSVLFLVFAVVVFGGLIFQFSRVIFDRKPDEVPVVAEPLTGKLSFLFLFALIAVLGLIIPAPLNRIITKAVEVINGI